MKTYLSDMINYQAQIIQYMISIVKSNCKSRTQKLGRGISLVITKDEVGLYNNVVLYNEKNDLRMIICVDNPNVSNKFTYDHGGKRISLCDDEILLTNYEKYYVLDVNSPSIEEEVFQMSTVLDNSELDGILLISEINAACPMHPHVCCFDNKDMLSTDDYKFILGKIKDMYESN